MNCLVLTVDFGERGRQGLIGEGLGWFSLTAGGATPIIWGIQVHVPLNNGTMYKEEGGRVRVTRVSPGLSPRGYPHYMCTLYNARVVHVPLSMVCFLLLTQDLYIKGVLQFYCRVKKLKRTYFSKTKQNSVKKKCNNVCHIKTSQSSKNCM